MFTLGHWPHKVAGWLVIALNDLYYKTGTSQTLSQKALKKSRTTLDDLHSRKLSYNSPTREVKYFIIIPQGQSTKRTTRKQMEELYAKIY